MSLAELTNSFYVYQPMIDPTDVVGFMDGLIFGLLQKEDLPEIQACLQHAPEVASEISDAIQDFTKGDVADIIAGIGEIGKVIESLPDEFKDCQSMQGDISRIEAWGEVFKNPVELLALLTKNVLANYMNIMQDVTKISTDFSAQNFKSAGEDVADILKQTIGPVPQAAIGEWKWKKKRVTSDSHNFLTNFWRQYVCI